LWSLPEGQHEQADSLRLFLAAPVPPQLLGAIEARYGVRVRGVYGMTEVFPLCLQRFADPAVAGAAGTANPSFELQLVDDEDNAVGVGEIGEIVARPLEPHVMFEGYDGRPADTLVQLRNLWFHTGDLARLAEDGNLFFVDRKKDAIRRRGENISSFEVEIALIRHPEVAECAAHAVPSELGEDDVKICVVRTEGSELSEAELGAYCAEQLPRFMVPRYIEFLDALPKTMTGRVRKVELRSRPIGPETWDGGSRTIPMKEAR
jgi:crotonobetaine/carnitine-CoA ligase